MAGAPTTAKKAPHDLLHIQARQLATLDMTVSMLVVLAVLLSCELCLHAFAKYPCNDVRENEFNYAHAYRYTSSLHQPVRAPNFKGAGAGPVMHHKISMILVYMVSNLKKAQVCSQYLSDEPLTVLQFPSIKLLC